MRNLSNFIKDDYINKNIDKLFENNICIRTEEDVNNVVSLINNGSYANVVFTNSILKNIFIDKLSMYRDNINVINCNSTVNRFFENNFDGFLVFNNLTHCKHTEIIDEIRKYSHKSILIC